MLQAETTDLLAGIAQIAAWTADDPAAAADPRQREQRSRQLLLAYRRMRARDPVRVERIVQTARDYARWLQHLGVSDPWALELPRVTMGQMLLSAARLALTAPLALVGAALGWLPYRAAAPFAARVTSETDVLGTVKLMAGALFVSLAWAAEATAAGLWLGPAGGWASSRWPPSGATPPSASANSPPRPPRPATTSSSAVPTPSWSPVWSPAAAPWPSRSPTHWRANRRPDPRDRNKRTALTLTPGKGEGTLRSHDVVGEDQRVAGRAPELPAHRGCPGTRFT